MVVNFIIPKNVKNFASSRLRIYAVKNLLIKNNSGIDVLVSNDIKNDKSLIIVNKFFDSKNININKNKYIIDLCDLYWEQNDNFFSDIFLENADAIIFGSEFLKNNFLLNYKKLNFKNKNFHVIEDLCGLDYRLKPNILRFPIFDYIKLRYRLTISKINKRKTILWYGNYGSKGRGGFEDFLDYLDFIEKNNIKYLGDFYVFSNKKYCLNLFNDRKITHNIYFFDWNSTLHYYTLKLFQIAIFPILLNNFTKSKSLNRILDAAASNLSIISSKVPGYLSFSNTMKLNIHFTNNHEEMSRKIEMYKYYKNNFNSVLYNNQIINKYIKLFKSFSID
jgi:hypothetical protein